jgi:hypothetical protein
MAGGIGICAVEGLALERENGASMIGATMISAWARPRGLEERYDNNN